MVDEKQSIVILSKLQAPQIRTKVLYRERLINSLVSNLNKKVILVCAGAGYGKTTLLSQLLSSKNIPYVYYHLEKSDAEPAVFFSYLVEGIRKFSPDFGKKTEALSHFFNYPQRYLELILGTFINEIIETVKEDLYIILEDYHTIYPAEHIDKILNYLLSHIPQQVHFIISSRVRPPLSVAQLQARDEIFEIGGQDLKFSKEETKDLFVSVYSISLSESELEWIEEHLEGWPTSLRLMLQSSNYFEKEKSSRYIKRILDSYYQSQSNLFNYFAQEIYDQESKSIRQYLVDCSILEWLTPELCDAVAKRKNSELLLAELTTRNAFIVDIPDIGYRFHHLFRDFLRSKINNVEKERRLYIRAGVFHFKNNRLEEAARFFLQAKEYDRAAISIERIAPGSIWRGRSAFLCSYIEKIPRSVRQQHPSLLMHYAEALIYLGRSDEAKKNCLRAANKFKLISKGHKQYADALYRLGGILLNQGRLTAAKRWFKKALSVCPKNARLTRASILNSIGSLYRAAGSRNLSEAAKYFQEALQIANRNEYKDLEASIINNYAMNDFNIGNLNAAHLKLLKTAELLKDHFSPGCGGGFFNAAKMSILLGNRKEALQTLESGIKTCGSYNDLWSMARIWQGYAQFHKEFGDLDKARQFISKALEIYEKLGVVSLIISAYTELCDINIRGGDLVAADRILAKTWLIKEIRTDFSSVDLLQTEATLRIAQGRYDDAEKILDSAIKVTKKFKQPFFSFTINLHLCNVYYYQNEKSRALLKLEKVVALSRSKGYDYLLARTFRNNKWMLQELRKDGFEHKYIMSLIDKYELDAHWIDVHLFGVPKVAVDEREILETSWTTMKSKKLFFYLLLHKNERVNHDVLIEALWQKASHKSGSDSLRKALQHIRQMYKAVKTGRGELVISSKGFYQLSPKVAIKIDTEEFENLVKKIKAADKTDKKYESMLRKAISIYKDGFAPGWYDSWVEDRRRYYQNLCEDCLLIMADYYTENKRYKDAIIFYKKLISANIFNEEYHRRIMTAYSKIGRYKEIIRDFEQLKKTLRKELGSEPHKETIDLFVKLVKTQTNT
jgi:ATP/maltotriose-dependent transcriptional regulator MalT